MNPIGCLRLNHLPRAAAHCASRIPKNRNFATKNYAKCFSSANLQVQESVQHQYESFSPKASNNINLSASTVAKTKSAGASVINGVEQQEVPSVEIINHFLEIILKKELSGIDLIVMTRIVDRNENFMIYPSHLQEIGTKFFANTRVTNIYYYSELIKGDLFKDSLDGINSRFRVASKNDNIEDFVKAAQKLRKLIEVTLKNAEKLADEHDRPIFDV